jgi:hypothetical protein
VCFVCFVVKIPYRVAALPVDLYNFAERSEPSRRPPRTGKTIFSFLRLTTCEATLELHSAVIPSWAYLSSETVTFT